MALAAQSSEETFDVWPENAMAVKAFVACSSQWRTMSAGLGGSVFMGIDYAAARVALDAHGLVLSGDDFRGFQVMEAEAARILNERPAS